jgi:hypothetical protein
MPEIGKMSSFTLKTMIKTIATQKLGIDHITIELVDKRLSVIEYGFFEEKNPKAIPTMSEIMKADIVNRRVAPSLSKTRDATGLLKKNEYPKSPVRAFLTYIIY